MNPPRIPHHAADRVKDRVTSYETPKKSGLKTPRKVQNYTPRSGITPKTSTRPTRLGAVKQEEKSNVPMGATREFIENRARRKARNAERISKESTPTLIPGGVNPFETDNFKENVMKMFTAANANLTVMMSPPISSGKIRFQREPTASDTSESGIGIEENIRIFDDE